jgi:ribokinase
MTAIVFGSINMDLVVRSPRLPKPGETLMGSAFYTTPGGKGANQAVALAKLGVPTRLVARLGGDRFADDLLHNLTSAGVNTDHILCDSATHSGVALITVSETGDNQIIGVLGANGSMDATDVQRLQPLLAQTGTLLLQLEIPIPTVVAAAKAAQASGVTVVLDPAPVPDGSLTALYPLVDILLPNEVEAGLLVGFPVNSPETADRAATVLQQQGATTVLIKLGAQGVFCATPEKRWLTPAFAVHAVDTVAAGDAFAGGLVAGLTARLPLANAVIWGCAAGAIATTQVGAQAAMPDRPTFDAFLQEHTFLP